MFSLALLWAGLTRIDHYSGLILVLAAILMAILFAFHSRVRGVRAGGKFEVPIASHEDVGRSEARPVGLRERPAQQERSSVSEYRDAAERPRTERSREARRS